MYSVFDGLTQSLLAVSDEYTESSEEESCERAKSESELEKEMWSYVSSAQRWKETEEFWKIWPMGEV